MKIKIFFTAICSVVLIGCSSGKKVVNANPKKVVLAPAPTLSGSSSVTEKVSELPTLKQNNKIVRATPTNTEEYIKKYAPIAIKKMHEHNIPASITLAQGVLESGSGRSSLAIKSNNHFGIKCHKGWQGKSVTHDDDEKGECFRKYKYPETSYEDHSQFLLTRGRYASLFKLGHKNYKGWAYGLKRAGYATDKKYPKKLIAIIKKYDLSKYDRISRNNSVTKLSSSNLTSGYHKVAKGDTLYSLSRKYKISVKNLKLINSLNGNTISIGQELKTK